MPACRSRYQLIPVIIGALQTNSWKPITSTYHVIASQLSPQTLLKPFTNQGRRPCSKPPRGMFWKAAWSFPLTRRRPCGSNLIVLLGPCTVQLSLSLSPHISMILVPFWLASSSFYCCDWGQAVVWRHLYCIKQNSVLVPACHREKGKHFVVRCPHWNESVQSHTSTQQMHKYVQPTYCSLKVLLCWVI